MIYLLGQNALRAHAALAEYIQPFRAPMQHLPELLSPATATGRALLDALFHGEAKRSAPSVTVTF